MRFGDSIDSIDLVSLTDSVIGQTNSIDTRHLPGSFTNSFRTANFAVLKGIVMNGFCDAVCKEY